MTHDIYEAIKMGDKIALMREGRLVQYGTPADLVYRPKDKFVEDFVGVDRALKGLQLIRVREVMEPSPPTMRADEKAIAAGERMKQEGTDWLAVVDGEGKFLGWISSLDLGRGETVRDIMRPSTVAATANTVLNEALSLMLSSGLITLAVVDRDNRLEGVLSFDDIRRGLSEVAQGESR